MHQREIVQIMWSEITILIFLVESSTNENYIWFRIILDFSETSVISKIGKPKKSSRPQCSIKLSFK